VHLGQDGPRIGELDEEMVHETKPGDVITLGASSWRAIEITRDRVIVAPAPGELGRLPFWRGDGPGRPIELGRALGRFTRKFFEEDDPLDWLTNEFDLDAYAATNLVDYLESEVAWTGTCPTDRRIVIERFRDELGDWRVCILSPFGSRIHAPWTLAISARLAAKGLVDAQPLWTDDGIMFRFADADRPPATELFLPSPDDVEDLVVDELGSSALFASQFRENAARALLLPRWRPGARTPLWVQRLRAQNLHAVAKRFRDFPIMLETYRSCMQDVFDLPGLIDLLEGIRSREISVDDVETPSASPFARSLVFSYTAAYLYQTDMPAAERRSQALSLDKEMLRELLGAQSLRELLDVEIIDAVEAQIQARESNWRAEHADAVHDILRRVGDLDDDELLARFAGDSAAIEEVLRDLRAAKRIVRVEVADRMSWIAAEEAGLYRDGLGVEVSETLPPAFLETTTAPLEQILMRFARTHGPFTTDRIAERFGLRSAQIEPVLSSLAGQGRLLSGEFDPRGHEREWCDNEVLRRIKRGTRNRLRDEISPVEGDVLCRFLLNWHGIDTNHAASKGDRPASQSRLDEAIDLLEGLPLSFVELERSILPARLANFDSRMLDERGALGQLVWVGCRAIGEKDGRVALYRRDRIAMLFDKPETEGITSPVERGILDALEARGASFFSELLQEVDASGREDVFAALWSLVWKGLVTNDTFAPLRALGTRPALSRRHDWRGRQSRRAPPSATSGRWSLVASLLRDPKTPTERLHARTLLYLNRHGIVSREAMAIEAQAGGFSSIYPVLREMEEAGRVRRGHFALGLTSAQVAVPGAVDRLRSMRNVPGDGPASFLAATDPAQPYGVLLDWPESRSGSPGNAKSGRPRRAVGASVVLVDGQLCLFIDGGGARVLSFCDEATEVGASQLERALRSLASGVGRMGLKRLRVEEIDGERARSSRLADAFCRAGFRVGYRGLELDHRGDGTEPSRGRVVESAGEDQRELHDEADESEGIA
jgi:ATP-dependent Lhr-like helicase